MNLQQLLDWSTARHPDRPALQSVHGETYTYRQLQNDARKVAAGLADLAGSGPVAVYSPNCIEMVVGTFAAWYDGRTVVPINSRAGADDLPYFVDDADADVFLYHDVSGEAVAACRDDLGADTLVQIGGSSPEWARPFGTLRSESGSTATVSDDDVATLCYTGGPSGPAGVPVTHEAWVYRALSWILRDGVVESDAVGLVLPLYHHVGIDAVVAAFQSGATVVLPGGTDPESVLLAVERAEVSTMQSVPAQFRALAEEARDGEYDTSSLRRLECAGGIVDEGAIETIQETLCRDLRNFHATSEAMNVAHARESGPTVGGAAAFQAIRVVEPGSTDPGETVEPTERGAVAVRADGPEAFEGYRNDPDATADAIHDGWLFTGDLGFLDEEGRLYLDGRTDEVVVVDGDHVPPGDVEDVLRDHPEVVEAAVVGRPDEEVGERVVAFVRSDGEPTADELDEFVRSVGEVSEAERPRGYYFVDDLPERPSGAIDRGALKRYVQESSG